MVKKYNAELASVTQHVNGVYTLEFKPLSGKFRYYPGQFLHLALDEYDPAAAWPESRCFSMQSSPEESLLRITYAVKGKFTQSMEKKMVPGSKIWLKLPFGDLFSQDHSKEDTVFIAGGTGVTPYLSLFNNPLFASYKNPHLYIGFRDKAHHLYENEFQAALKVNPSLTITVFYQDITGIIDINSILENHKDSGHTSFFISGPPVMIRNFKNFFLENGISGQNIKTDDWE